MWSQPEQSRYESPYLHAVLYKGDMRFKILVTHDPTTVQTMSLLSQTTQAHITTLKTPRNFYPSVNMIMQR